MAYQQQRPGYPHGQNYGGTAGVSALASKASELGGKMGGVTPEIWDNVLSQMQQLVEDNEKLRETLKANNNEISSLVTSKEEEVKHFHKLYWDARVSVLGFKAQIVKLNGEKDHDKQRQSDMSRLEEDKEALRQKAVTTSDLSKKLNDEIEALKHDLSDVQRKEQRLREENDFLRKSQSQPPANQGLVDSLERQLNELKTELTEERASNSKFQSKISNLNEELKEAQDMNVSLGAQIGQLQRTSGASKSETDLQNRLQAKERELQEKESEFRAMKNQLEGEIREMKIDLKAKDRKLLDKDGERELQRQLREKESQYRNKIDDLKFEIEQMKREMTVKDKELTDKERELQARERELEDYKQRPDNPDGGGGETVKSGLIGNKKRLNDEIGKNKRLSKEVESLKGQLASAASSEELATLKREKERVIREKERLAREKDQLQQDLDESRNTEQDSVDELSKAKDDCTHLESVNNKLEIERGNLITQLENEKERVHELNVQLSKAQSDLDQTKKQLQQARAEAEGENTDLDKMMEEMSNETIALTEEVNNKNEEIRRQKSHILQVSKERDDAVSKAAAFAKERDNVATEYQKKENKIKADCQKKIDEYLGEAEQWKIQFETAREDFGSERAAREKEAKAVDALRSNRESLQKQVDELKDKVTLQQRTIANLEERLGKHEPIERTAHHPGPHVPIDRSPGPIDRGPRPMDRGPGPIDHGDRGPGHGGRPDRPSSGGQRMGGGGGGESPRNYRPSPDDREWEGRRSHTVLDPRPPRGGGGGGNYGSGRGDYGGGGVYPRHQNEPQRFPERRPEDDRNRSRPDDYQSGNVRPGATYSGHPRYERGGGAMGGVGGRMDDQRGRQFNPGGERRDFPPPQQPQPYVDFTPLPMPPKEGGAGGGRRGSDLNDLNQPRGQSGGGELFMGPPRGGGGGGGGAGGHDPRRQFPPEGGDGGNFHLPGEKVDSRKPTGECPICGVGNFATQTDLELHAAKCDKFNF